MTSQLTNWGPDTVSQCSLPLIPSVSWAPTFQVKHKLHNIISPPKCSILWKDRCLKCHISSCVSSLRKKGKTSCIHVWKLLTAVTYTSWLIYNAYLKKQGLEYRLKQTVWSSLSNVQLCTSTSDDMPSQTAVEILSVSQSPNISVESCLGLTTACVFVLHVQASERSPDGERHVLPWPCKITPQGPFTTLNDTHGPQLSSPDPCHRNTVDTDQRTQTGGQGHKQHLQTNAHTLTQTHKHDSSVPAVCQNLCQAACALCLERCVAQEWLSQSMAGSLGSACVLDGCPIRRSSILNCAGLIGKDRTSETGLRASWTQRRDSFGQHELTAWEFPPLSISFPLSLSSPLCLLWDRSDSAAGSLEVKPLSSLAETG